MLLSTTLFLSSCGHLNGLKIPLYDGKPIKQDEDAITIYESTGEVIGEEKNYYIRHSFSEDLLEDSLNYPSEEPILLEEGHYIIGEDLPAGRATFLGNESSFSTESYDIHVGNLSIRDKGGALYFENLFHSEYGQLTAQVDLIEGHEINIVGKEPEITVFYSEELPENPYVLMELPELIQNLDQTAVQEPLEVSKDAKVIYLTAGIYEVGVHFKAGEYYLSALEAPHNTEIYLFREGTDPRVIELLLDSAEKRKQEIIVQLLEGDKIYLNLVNQLKLNRLADN